MFVLTGMEVVLHARVSAGNDRRQDDVRLWVLRRRQRGPPPAERGENNNKLEAVRERNVRELTFDPHALTT